MVCMTIVGVLANLIESWQQMEYRTVTLWEVHHSVDIVDFSPNKLRYFLVSSHALAWLSTNIRRAGSA